MLTFIYYIVNDIEYCFKDDQTWQQYDKYSELLSYVAAKFGHILGGVYMEEGQPSW